MLATYPQKLVATKKSSNLSRPWFSFLQSLLDLLQTPRRFFGHHSMGDKLTPWDSPKNGGPVPRWLLDFADDWGDGRVNSDLALSNAPKSWSHALLHILRPMVEITGVWTEYKVVFPAHTTSAGSFEFIYDIYIFTFISYIASLSISCICSKYKITKSVNIYIFPYFSHVHHHQTIKLLIKLWLLTKSQKLHQCLSQASVKRP